MEPPLKLRFPLDHPRRAASAAIRPDHFPTRYHLLH